MKRKYLIAVTVIFIGIISMAGLNFAEEKTDETQIINRIVTISVREGIKPATLFIS